MFVHCIVLYFIHSKPSPSFKPSPTPYHHCHTFAMYCQHRKNRFGIELAHQKYCRSRHIVWTTGKPVKCFRQMAQCPRWRPQEFVRFDDLSIDGMTPYWLSHQVVWSCLITRCLDTAAVISNVEMPWNAKGNAKGNAKLLTFSEVSPWSGNCAVGIHADRMRSTGNTGLVCLVCGASVLQT